MRRLLAVTGLVVLVLLYQMRAPGQDDQYLRIYSLIQEGDGLKNSDQATRALAKYLEAQTALTSFQKVNPDWNSKVVNYRLGYLASRITEISSRMPAVVSTTKSNATASGPGVTPDLDARLSDSQEQVRQLEMDKAMLEAKLKEALSALPATVDPHELARAEQQIRALQKENDLLKVTLSEDKSASALDPKFLEQAKKDLADANRKLTEQTEKADTLAAQKETLQTRLDSLIPANWNEKNIDRARKELEEANRRLSEQTARASQLSLEKDALTMRIKALTADAEAAAALRAENEILKKQVADLKSAPEKTPDMNRQWAEAQAQIAALQSEKEMLRVENLALEIRVKKLSSPAALIVSAPSADGERLKQLEHERDDLRKRLEATEKELSGRNAKGANSRVQELTGRLEVLQTRLAVFEAQRVPYTPEELALFKMPEPQIADAKANKKSVKVLPPAAVTLVAEAQRDFSARRFDVAEEKYLKVLSQDESNVYTLANLAAIQLERGRLDQAETNITKALAANPDDAYSLSIMGYLRFKQERYDDAMDVLGRAAKADPRNPEIQNYLGLTLSQKGMRGPAETALRKALELNPNYAGAHYNLAVVYATQKPPATALARWHYNRARAAGLAASADLERMLEQGQTASAAHGSN
jgi:Flp pilus assembly protein TadD